MPNIDIDLDTAVILDTEATGLNDGMQLDEPVEIAVTDPLGNTLFHTFVKPTVAITPGAFETHGINQAMLADAPHFDQVADELARVIGDRRVWMYNAPYDVRLLINAAVNQGVVPHRFDYACVMRAYAEAFGVVSERRPGEFKWWPLSVAYEQQFGHVLPDAHSAAVDCEMTARLLTMIYDGDITDAPGHTFQVVFKQLTIEFTKSRAPYAVFTTEGGQKVNVFQDRWSQLTRSGFPIHAESGRILKTTGKSIPVALDEPMGATITYKGEWPELAEIGTGVWGD